MKLATGIKTETDSNSAGISGIELFPVCFSSGDCVRKHLLS